jgi:hypothetical protein
MRARISSLYTHEPAEAGAYGWSWGRLKPAPTFGVVGAGFSRLGGYSTIVSCELENENGWKIVVRPNASFALTV